MHLSITVVHPWCRHCRHVLSNALRLARAFMAPRGTSLHELDAHTLRDIGIDASEIALIKAETCGQAELSRLRIIAGAHLG